MSAGDFVEAGGKAGDVGGCGVVEVEWWCGAVVEEELVVGGGEVDEERSSG